MKYWSTQWVLSVTLVAVARLALADTSSLPWTPIFQSPESSIHLLREAPGEGTPGQNPTTRIWYLEDRKIAMMIGLLNMKTYSSQIQRWEVDCQARAYRMSGAVYFEDHMGNGNPLRTVPAREGFEIAPANPMMNAIFAAACGSTAAKPITAKQQALLPQMP